MTGLDPTDRAVAAAPARRPGPATSRDRGVGTRQSVATVGSLATGGSVRADRGVRADRAIRLASALHSAGVRANHRVSLVLEPGPARSATVAACLRLGAVVVAASPDLPDAEVASAHAAARPDVVVGDRHGLRLVRRLRGPALWLAADRPRLADRFVGGALPLVDLVTRHLLVALPPAPDPHGDAALLFVPSDRPGEGPLGVHWTHEDLEALAGASGRAESAAPWDVDGTVPGPGRRSAPRGARAASVPLALDVLDAAGGWRHRHASTGGPAPARRPALV